MRKLSFYPKLALGNLLRNRSTYLPYLLACITSVFTFYTLLAINNNPALQTMRGASIVLSFTAIGTFIVAVFCSILLFYTNSFLMKRRKKELGLYCILGMEKGNIGLVMFFETLFIALVAIVAGVGAGLLLSKLLFMLLMRLTRLPVNIQMSISPETIGVTIFFFVIIFMLTLLTNLRQVRKANPISLISGAKQGEKEPKASWIITILGILFTGAGYAIALWVQSPVEALMLFLLAAFLVIIGTYCLFTSGSIALLKLLRKNKNYYYKPKHFISVSGLIYRMKQNAAGLASICILSCMVLVTVASTVSLYTGSESSLRNLYPNEYTINFTQGNTHEGATSVAGTMQQLAAQTGVELTHAVQYPYLETAATETAEQFASTTDYDSMNNVSWVKIMALEDYNKIENTAATLQPGQAFLFSELGNYNYPNLTLNGITYQVQTLSSFQGNQGSTAGVIRTLIVVVPTKADIEAAAAALPEDYIATAGNSGRTLRWEYSFNLAGTEENCAAFDEAFTQARPNLAAGVDVNFGTRVRADVREEWYATNGGFMFLGIYFGILFLLSAAMIIYYKQISEGYDDRERFEIMQKVGMSQREVWSTIKSQIKTVFFLPLVVAVVHIAFAFSPVSKAMLIFGIYNTPALLLATAITVLAYTLIYAFLYRRTAKAYYGIVKREA